MIDGESLGAQREFIVPRVRQNGARSPLSREFLGTAYDNVISSELIIGLKNPAPPFDRAMQYSGGGKKAAESRQIGAAVRQEWTRGGGEFGHIPFTGIEFFFTRVVVVGDFKIDRGSSLSLSLFASRDILPSLRFSVSPTRMSSFGGGGSSRSFN